MLRQPRPLIPYVFGQGAANGNLRNGLVGWWRMDEASWSGTTGEVVDSSGGGNHGTAQNGATPAAGLFANAGNFDGISKYAAFGNSAGLQPSLITLSVWVKLNAVANVGIISKRSGAFSNHGYSLAINGSGFFSFQISNDGFTRIEAAASGLSLATGTWYHVVGTYNGTTLTIYVNGSALGTNTGSGSIFASTANLYIGAANDPAGFVMNGLVDDARIYNRALSAAEVTQLYNFIPA